MTNKLLITHFFMIGAGPKIRKTRELKNFTQEYVAKELGITQGAYSAYEKPQADVKSDMIEKIAKVLGVTKDQIEQFDESIYFNTHSNTVNDQSKVNLLGNSYNVTINQHSDDEKDDLQKKTISLLEEKIEALEKQVESLKKQLR